MLFLGPETSNSVIQWLVLIGTGAAVLLKEGIAKSATPIWEVTHRSSQPRNDDDVRDPITQLLDSYIDTRKQMSMNQVARKS